MYTGKCPANLFRPYAGGAFFVPFVVKNRSKKFFAA
jgi:hypothetical protein